MKKHCLLNPTTLLIVLLLFVSVSQAQSSFSCADTSYRMRFSSPGKEFRFYTHCNTADGGTVLTGYITDTGTASNNNIVVLKLDATGGVVWKTAFPNISGNGTYFSRIIEQSNGELAAYGYTRTFNSNFREIILLKFSANGSLLWSNKYSLNSHFAPNDILHPFFLSEGVNHDLLLTIGGTHDEVNLDSTYAVMARINNAGSIIWSKAFTNDPTSYGMRPAGIYEKNGEVLTFGYVDNVISYCGLYAVTPYAIKMDYASGQPLLTKAFCHLYPASNASELGGSPERDYYNSVKLLDGQFALFGRFENVTDKRYGYKLVFDNQLNLVKARQYDVPKQNASTLARLSVLPDETTHFFYLGANNTQKQVYWASLDADNNIIRQRKMMVDQNGTTFGGYLNFGYRNSETYNFSTYYRINGRRYSLFTQLQRNDPAIDSCLGTDTTFVSYNPLNWSETTWTWKTLIDNPLIATPLLLTASDFVLDIESLCTQTSRCDSLRISGTDTLCVTDNFVSFTGLKNPDCRKRVLWTIADPLVDSLFQPDDSTLMVRFKPLASASPQTLRLEASAANCTIAKDTADIVLLPGLKPLPPDTIVCGDVNIRLTPGKWGKNYHWQDGSTDSVFIATDTGRYTVIVEPLCGGVFSDTIYITKPFLQLTADQTTICKGDTVLLSATPGFSAYQWQAGLLTLSDSVWKAIPSDTTDYFVSAQTASGCIVADSVLINVLHPPKIDLGKDTAFCMGDSMRLQAPASFLSYQWSNGSTASSVSVTQSGEYWVKVVDANGCTARDSIAILPLYPKPAVSILPKNIVCLGQNDTLRAGSFAQYRWSNGSRDAFLPVRGTGSFWVNIVDGNGCPGSDTATITKIALPPQNFLPADTIVCAGSSVQLKPGKSFNQYQWSNGARSEWIDITVAGLYRLEVKDSEGCIGSDSVLVLHKACPNRILFPSAFTPNDDGKNDLFRPFVQGQLTSYRLNVYNRWGQAVFQSTDHRKGWDGYFGGLLQGNGVFVWVCHYQFAGENKIMGKGTLTLIK